MSTLRARKLKMRRMQILLFFLGIIWFSPRMSGRQNQDDQELTKRFEKSVTVHVDVVGQSYCHVDDEAFSASLDLRLRFSNSSDRPVILSRKIESPNIVRVARDADAANKRE